MSRFAEVCDELTSRNGSAEVVLIIDDVDVVNRLQVFGDMAERSSALAYRERFGKLSDVRRHHRAGGAFGVACSREDVSPLLDRH